MQAMYADENQYLCIGDTILLSYKQRVFHEEYDNEEIHLKKERGDVINEADFDLNPVVVRA